MKNDKKRIPGVKGFDKDMRCRGFQYKEGETYTHEGEIASCKAGFHFCENPIDVFSYYSPGESVFHEVVGSGKTVKHRDDTKVVYSEIKIGGAISLHDIISSGIEFMSGQGRRKTKTKHGCGSVSVATGYKSVSVATGYKSISSATGDSSVSSSTGDRSISSATDCKSVSSATGCESVSSTTGFKSVSSITGDRSVSVATGYESISSATGNASAAMVTGAYSKAMAGRYGCIALSWWNKDGQRMEMRCSETGCGDGSDGKLKADVWYRLNSQGDFEEALYIAEEPEKKGRKQ